MSSLADMAGELVKDVLESGVCQKQGVNETLHEFTVWERTSN